MECSSPSSRLYSIMTVILALCLLDYCQADESPSYLAKIHELRDIVNQKRSYLPEQQQNGAKQKKPKRYKCILIDDEEEAGTTLNNRLDKLSSPSFMKELKIKASQKHNHDEVEENGEADSQPFVTTQPNRVFTPFYGLPAEDQTNSFVYTPKPDEVEEPNEFLSITTTANPRPIITALNKPLRQVMLPRAHGIPLRRVLSPSQAVQAGSQTAAPPANSTPQASIPRDGSNRALVLAPENCKMIEHYAGLYGVKDVKSWVHHNCSFAKMYLPTASCAEIDVLVGSCNIAGSL